MNLRDLSYLVALADHKHFGRAAEASFVSQPTLSTQIKKLETELGVQLVERAPKQVLLTDVGEDIVRRARGVLRDVEQIKETARRTADPQAGTVRIGLFPTVGPYLLPHAVPNIRKRFPRLELLLTEEKTEIIIAQLREGRLDAGVLAMPVEDDTLEHEFLFEEPFVLALPQDHPLAGKTQVATSDLVDQSLLLLEEGHCLRDQALEVCGLAGADERIGFRATSLETLRQMVAAHVGMTLMPMLAVKPPIAQSGETVLLPFSEPAPSRRIALYWRRSSALGAFLQELAGAFSDLPEQLLDPETLI